MGKIFSSQTDLTIKLTTGKDLSNVASVFIKYEKPNRETGEFVASIVDEAQGIIQYAVISANDINVTGRWRFWAKVIDDYGLVSIGESVDIIINKEGT